MEVVRIPAERVAVLIGENGKNKEMLEKASNVGMDIESEGAVHIKGEPVDVFFSKDVVKAIGRGFDPETALKLLKDQYMLKVIRLRDFLGSRKAIVRIKGRIIGERGKTKNIIEEITGANIVVYGNTVALIGELETLDIAVNAVFKLIEGSTHSKAYAYMQKNMKRIKEESMLKGE